MKVIFLDHDGVICLSNNWGSRYKKQKKFGEYTLPTKLISIENRFDDFDKGAIHILNDILIQTGVEIVISSDWKNHANLEEMGDYYIKQGIIKRPLTFTPNLRDFDKSAYGMYSYTNNIERIRVIEIKKYLRGNKDITRWVSIDDLYLGTKYNDQYLTNFVHTWKVDEGIKQKGVKEKILKYLID
jgi:hypothetical protein